MPRQSIVEVSLRDVEPVLSFVKRAADIRNRMPADALRDEFDQAFRDFYGGFSNGTETVSNEVKVARGWKLAKSDVPHPERSEWPSVCIVIPVFNSPELLKRCLVSLMRTDYPGSLVHTTVDNASTDPETAAILDGRDHVGPRFDEPVGFAAAVNAGIRACPGFDYYVLFNQDCRVIDEQWLTHLINWMGLRPKCAVAGAKLLYPDGKLQHAGMLFPGCHRLLRQSADLPDANCYEKVQSVTGAVFAIRASVLSEVGYLDETYRFHWEDVEFCLRAAILGWETWYVPDSVVVHHDNGVRKDHQSCPETTRRIGEWIAESDAKFRKDWWEFAIRCRDESVAIVLAVSEMDAGMLNYFLSIGMETAAFGVDGSEVSDNIKPISELREAGTLVAIGAAAVAQTKRIPAKRKFYLADGFAGLPCEDEALRCMEYEVIVTDPRLAERVAESGRTCKVMDADAGMPQYAELILGAPNVRPAG